MSNAFRALVLFFFVGVLVSAGCAWPTSQATRLKRERRQLAARLKEEQQRAETLEIQNRNITERLAESEKQVAQLYDKDSIKRQPTNLSPGGARLAALARSFPILSYDAKKGVGKVDVDLLFESGQAELKANAKRTLDELSDLLQSNEASDLRLVITGHADAQKIKGREVRQLYPNNWRLSAARALTVADYLDQNGVDERRLSVFGLGRRQPVTENESAEGRRLNRRVEIFLIEPETPLIGWNSVTGKIFR